MGAGTEGRDSNPRWTYAHAGFQDRCIQPLCHPSGRSTTMLVDGRPFRRSSRGGRFSMQRRARASRLPFLTGTGGRAAEGAPLLREYGVYSSIEGSNPSLSVHECPVTTGDRGLLAPRCEHRPAAWYSSGTQVERPYSRPRSSFRRARRRACGAARARVRGALATPLPRPRHDRHGSSAPLRSPRAADSSWPHLLASAPHAEGRFGRRRRTDDSGGST